MKDNKTTHNRLIHEKSPYLLQHADNPVDWFPWGEEAFAKAQKEDKPIFLSIGYSTCHWCHVMEHESFEDPNIAKLLNEYFVAIKVDREERPDIDGVYMSAVQIMTGRGGWPMSIFMTPEKKPFFGGTYFPPEAKWGSPGFVDVLNSIHEAWTNKREQIVLSSNNLTEMIKSPTEAGAGEPMNKDVLAAGYRMFQRSFDSIDGGFGQAPKFPTAHNLSFLLRYWAGNNERAALDMVLLTLKKMAEGGMYDHVGGGFHRYSTDQMWQIPHFEKMLYDEAMLARVYLEGYQITHDAFYADIVREVFAYVLRDLHDTQGGFYSAEDADSLESKEAAQKKEGAFYVWTQRELKDHLSPEEFDVFSTRYDILPGGNAHSDPHEEFVGKNIVFVKRSLEETATKLGKPVEKINALLAGAKKKLFKIRETRPRPHLDDKVLTDWNGLMIASLAFGGRVLQEPAYIKEAERAADFIRKNLIDQDGRLLHRYRDGDAAIKGTLEDYAFFVHGLIELYEATFKIEYLELAFKLSDRMLELFADKAGGFYLTGKDAEELIVRQKEIYDGAIPSGNSMAALNLVRLYHISLDTKWEKQYTRLFDHFAPQVSQNPSAYTQMLMAYQFALGPSQEIVVAGKKTDAAMKAMTDLIFDAFLPQRVILGRTPEDLKALTKLSSFIEIQEPIDGKTTVFLCESHICKLPVNDLEQFKSSIQKITKRP